jgi:hypothetical protein
MNYHFELLWTGFNYHAGQYKLSANEIRLNLFHRFIFPAGKSLVFLNFGAGVAFDMSIVNRDVDATTGMPIKASANLGTVYVSPTIGMGVMHGHWWVELRGSKDLVFAGESVQVDTDPPSMMHLNLVLGFRFKRFSAGTP